MGWCAGVIHDVYGRHSLMGFKWKERHEGWKWKKAKVAENEKAQGFKVDTKHFERETDIPNEHSM